MKNHRIISFFFALVVMVSVFACFKWNVQAISDNAQHGQSQVRSDEPPDEFFAGTYVIIGQKPGDGLSYKGRAEIEIKDKKILLSRTIGGKTKRVEGVFHLAGEMKRKSLKFEWKNGSRKAEMLCQYSIDFDNYPRLTCLWSDGGDGTKRLPGFETYYPLAPFSD